MSVKPYEDYLAQVFISWASNTIQPGYRYQFKSPDQNNAQALYQAFSAKSSGVLQVNEIRLPYVLCGQTKLLPVLHGDGENAFSENYISHLRDLIAGRDGFFHDCALMIIHNSKLDTITNSAEDVTSDGRIWHPAVFSNKLADLIEPNSPSRHLLKCLLDDQLLYVTDEGATIFGFAPLYESIAQGKVELSKLGFFNDPLLESMDSSPAQMRRRLEENRELRRQIEFVTENYPDQLEDMFREFGPRFVRQHFIDKQDWRELSYGEFKAEIDSNEAQKLSLEEITCAESKLIERAKSTTKAGQKDWSVLVEVPPDKSEALIELKFLAHDIEAKQIKISHVDIANKDNLVSVNRLGGKRCRVQVRMPFNGEPRFFTISLKRELRSEQHQFRCLLLKQGDFYVDAFRNLFRIEPNHQRITLQMEENSLSVRPTGGATFVSEDAADTIDVEQYAIVDFSKQANSSENIGFSVSNGLHKLNFNVEGAAAEETVSVPFMFDRDRYLKLFKDDDYCVEYNSRKNRLIVDNREGPAVGLRQKLLILESEMVSDRVLHHGTNNVLALDSLEGINSDLYAAYIGWYEYLIARRTTPSLVSWGPIYRQLTRNVINAYETALSAIPRDCVLTEGQKTFLKIGMVCIDGVEYISPFHPMVLSYHLELCERIVADRENGFESFALLPDVTRERLSAAGLLPFVYAPSNGVAHVSPVRENQFWLELIPQKEASFSYVRNLVRDKVAEFTQAYSRLFSAGPRSTLVVNAINLGAARELFLGLSDYFKNRREEACAIHVNFYDDALVYNDFDRFAETASLSDLKDWFQLGRGGIYDDADLLIDLIRSRLTYSKFRTPGNAEQLQYAHLAFFRNNAPVDVRPVNIETSLSGVLCDGLISGESAASTGDAYFTSFGLQGIDYKSHQPLRLAYLVGTLMQPARQANMPYLGHGIGLAASTLFKELLSRSYDSALWTTIIDPKVTLDFFTSQRDVVLIHYSDQYTSSAGYDAITVTKQVDLFRRLLRKESLLSEFNAFNGEWLLKMLTAGDTIRKERQGIIGGYKFVHSMLIDSGISWVPLSVAEMIRVSGNVGLKISESDFSRGLHGANKGAVSDDVLFVGFKENKLYLLPLEVKTGARPDYKKAIKQALEQKRYLKEEILGPRSLAGKLYRGLFVRQVLMQVEKYRLYNVLNEDQLSELLQKREWWLQGDYEIGELIEYPSGFVVAHIESDACVDPSYVVEEDVLLIELPYALLDGLIDTNSIAEMNKIRTNCHVPDEYLLKGTSGDVRESPKAGSAEKFAAAVDQVPASGSSFTHSSPLVEASPATVDVLGASEPLRILFGHNTTTQAPLYWEPTNTARFMNSNSGIIGTMGTGKTQFTKSIITQLVRNEHNNVNNQPVGVLIFDYKSDYVDDEFVKATNASHHKLALLPYNPLSLFGDTPMLPLHTAAGFAETMTRAYSLGKKQQLKLENLIIESYEKAGIVPEDKSTWSKTPPTIEDIWQLFLSQEKVEEDSLYAALAKLARFKIFESEASKIGSLYDLISGVTVIELAGYPSEIQNLVVALTLDLFYAQMQKKGKPKVVGNLRQITKMILVDEADNFMSQNFPALRRILKEGREYGVGVILSTQDITHFKTSDNDYSSYILTWVVHRVAQIKNSDVKAIFNKDDKADQEQLMETIRKLDKHYSLYVDGEKRLQKMRDTAFWELLQ